MTPQAANGRNGFPSDGFRQLLGEWIRVLRHLRRAWGNAKRLNTKLGKQQKTLMDISAIMTAPKCHAPVMVSMREACGDRHRSQSPHAEPEFMIPAEFLTVMGDIVAPMEPCFFVMSIGKPGPVHYALDYTTKQLIKVPYGSKQIKGPIVNGIPTQIGDNTSKPKPMGNYWQLQPVCGEERNGTMRGITATVPTQNAFVLAECDSEDPEVLADSDVIGDNLPFLCAAVTDTGNRGTHKVFVVPNDEKESLKASLDGIWEMLGYDPTGWDDSKLNRLPNTVRGKGRGGKPQKQTLLWLAPTPTRLTPNSKFQTVDQFLAAFAEAVVANADSITEEIRHMEAAIADLEKHIAEGNQRLDLKSKPANKSRSRKSSASAKGGSEKMQAIQDLSIPVFREGRTMLRKQLAEAGPKLVLTSEVKSSVLDILSKHHTLDDDPLINRREIERIVGKICDTPHRRIGTGIPHIKRPAQNVPDEEFYGSLNFHYTPAFWATEPCRARLQRTETCFAEFAFVALVLHTGCDICRSDILRWLKRIYKTRNDGVSNAHIEVPGQLTVSDRAREVTEGVLPPEQAKEVIKRWSRNYECESDLDALLLTMHKHLSAAGWKPWKWIDEDLYRLEEKYWTKEQAACGAYRLERITVAVDTLIASQFQVKGKKKRVPKVTSAQVCSWLETHPEYDFRVSGKHKAKLTSILRGLCELVKLGHLREVVPDRKKTSGRDRIFRPSENWSNSLNNKGVTEQQVSSSATNNASNKKVDVEKTNQPSIENEGEPKLNDNVIVRTNKKTKQKPSNKLVKSNRQSARKSSPLTDAEIQEQKVAKALAREAAKKAKREAKENIQINIVAWWWAWCVILANRMRPNMSITLEAFMKGADGKTEWKKQVQEWKKAEAKLAARLRCKGIPGETFRLQQDTETGKILIGRYDRGLNNEEQVGNFYRRKVAPIILCDTVPVAVETMEKTSYEKLIVTALICLSPTDESRLVANGALRPRTFVKDCVGRNYLRVKFKLHPKSLPKGAFENESEFRLEACKKVLILTLQGKQIIPNDKRNPYWLLGVAKYELAQIPALSNQIEFRQIQAAEAKKRMWM